MKVKYLYLFLTLFFAYPFNGNAQAPSKSSIYNDSLPWLKAPLFELIGDTKLNLAETFVFQNKGQALSVSGISRKPVIPRGVRIVRSPLILKRGKICYAFNCKDNGCDNCMMMWKDTNRDGKVQPRRELRCGCPGKGKKQCKIRVRARRCN